MTQPAPEQPFDDDSVEAWRDLQAVLEERDREYWASGEPANDTDAEHPS